MIRDNHAHGGCARVHSHGRVRNILDIIAEMGADALDPIEPPPQGDVTLSEVRQRYGRQFVLFGNLEISDIELLPSASPYSRTLSPVAPGNFEAMVRLVEAWQSSA